MIFPPLNGSPAIYYKEANPFFIKALLANPSISSPGIAGTKNGSVTWTGGTGGLFKNGLSGQLCNTNYLLWSQDFAQTWALASATLTAAQLAPDGTYTAFKLIGTAAAYGYITQSIAKAAAVQVWTGSIFCKSEGKNTFHLRLTSGANLSYAVVNLTTGVVTITNSGITGTGYAYEVTGQAGVWRVVLTVTTGADATLILRAQDDTVGDGANGFRIWGAQLEPGDTATDYVPTLSAAQAHCVWSFLPFPGFSAPRMPQVVGSALDGPFRHPYRIGQNMLINSAWDGAVAGAPGTPPTSWSDYVTDGSLAVPAQGQLAFTTIATKRRIIIRAVSLAANTTYIYSVRILAATGQTLVLNEVINSSAVPAGTTVSVTRNGAAAGYTDLVYPGDTIAFIFVVAGTAGSVDMRCGLGCSGATLPVWSVTLTEPQVEPGTVRSVYTPTTTAAISAVVCEPVKASEEGIVAMFHAQGARTNLVSASWTSYGMAAGAGITAGVRRIIEDTGNSLHILLNGITLTVADAAPYRNRLIFRVRSGSRKIIVYLSASGSWGVSIDPITGVATGYNGTDRTVSNIVTTPLGDGRYLVEWTATQTTGGALTPGLVIGLSNGIGISPPTYVGDGTSGVDVEFFAIEAAAFSGLPLGEGVALTAQAVKWNMAALTGQVGELVSLDVPYLWSAAVSAAHPAGSSYRIGDGAGNMGLYKSAASDFAERKDTGSQSAAAASPALASGQGLVVSEAWDATLREYQGSTLKATDAAVSPPWVNVGALFLASYSGASFWWFGTETPVLFNGRTATEAERSIVAAGLARTLVPAA
jgi:hypothetical protein